MTRTSLSLRIGAICLLAGGMAVFGFRAAHGDLPAADAGAALAFIAGRPIYAAIHLGAILGAIVWVGGLVALASTSSHPAASVGGRLGAAIAIAGAAVYAVEFSVDGFGGRALAAQWSAASGTSRVDIELAAGTVFHALEGTSLVSIALLWGLSPLLFGLAVGRDGYPRWVGWTGVAVGAITVVAATGQFLRPDLVPGVWIYGGLVSLVQLWGVALGIAMWRRASSAPYPAGRMPPAGVRGDPRSLAYAPD